MSDIADLQSEIAAFADERDWKKFHTPKNLSMALSGEAGELLSEFQWLDTKECWSALQAGDLRDRVTSEVADVAIYLLRLADVLDIDIREAVERKMAGNADRYTVADSRGNAEKR